MNLCESRVLLPDSSSFNNHNTHDIQCYVTMNSAARISENEIGFQSWLHEISDFHYFMGHRGIKEDYDLFLEYRLPAPEWWMEIQMKG